MLLDKIRAFYPGFQMKHFSMFDTITYLKWETVFDYESWKQRKNLSLTMISQKNDRIQMTFLDVDSFRFRGNGQIGGFYIKDMSVRGYEKDSEYEIGDYESDELEFYCSDVIVNEFQKGDAAGSISNGRIPTENVLRVVDAELSSGKMEKNVLYRDIASYIMLVEEGEEDFLILSSHDGFLQFYGVNNQFVAEIRVNLPGNDFRTYSVINENKKYLTDRVRLTTPYGEYTPTAREVVSLELIETIVREYYEKADTDQFLKNIPCTDTTEETKRYMGLIK